AGGFTSKYVRYYPQGWNIVGVGDANRAGRSDIFWHNPTAGRVQIWRMNGATFTYGPTSSIGAYTVEGIGDFNGDGFADLVWANVAKTQVWVWLGAANGGYSTLYVRGYPAGWTIAGVGDVNN